MNVKKTIAAIAAIAIAASATSLAPLFTGISAFAEGEAIGAENTDTLADTNAGISPLGMSGEDAEPEPEPIPVVIPSVYLIGGNTATTGTYTVTLEIEGASANTAAITVVVYGKNIEFTRRADGKYTADIEITNENLEAFKKGFVIWTLDEKSYTVTKAEVVIKAEVKPPVTNPDTPAAPVEPEPVPVVTPDVYLIGGSTATTGTYTVTLEIEGASANTAAITVVIYGKNVEFIRRADGKYTADIEITNENLEAFKKGFVIWTLDEKSYTVTKAEAVIKAEEKPPIKDTDTPVKPAPTPIVPYYPPVITNTPVNPSADTSAAAVSAPVQIAASQKSNITIKAGDTDVTPAMLEAFTKNRTAKTMTLSYSSTLKIVIDKKDINGAAANLDFSVSGKNFLSASAIKNLDAEKVVQIDFVSNGDFGDVDKVTVRSRVGAKFSGKKVTVYEYVNGKLVKVGTGKVGGSGLVNFKTDHFGQFVIAVE